MGVYDEQVLPRLTNILLGNAEFGRKIRAGIWTVEPSRVALELARSRIAASSAPVHSGTLDGKRLDFPDDRFDSALRR